MSNKRGGSLRAAAAAVLAVAAFSGPAGQVASPIVANAGPQGGSRADHPGKRHRGDDKDDDDGRHDRGAARRNLTTASRAAVRSGAGTSGVATAPITPGGFLPPGAAETAGPALDPFGVAMLYPTKPGGEEWYLAPEALEDPRFDPQDDIRPNGDGSWRMRSSKVRMNVFTSSGYEPERIATYDRDRLARQGYMQDPNDWQNVEITGFVRVRHANDIGENLAWYARGGRHNDSAGGCEGSAYKGDLHYDGAARIAKESRHVEYEHAGFAEDVTAPLADRWVGFKTVIRNVVVEGRPAAKVDLYVDADADRVTWTKVDELVDDGTWGGDASACGATAPARPITWGGPVATFRWDGADDVDFEWLSVREIAECAPLPVGAVAGPSTPRQPGIHPATRAEDLAAAAAAADRTVLPGALLPAWLTPEVVAAGTLATPAVAVDPGVPAALVVGSAVALAALGGPPTVVRCAAPVTADAPGPARADAASVADAPRR